VYNTTQLRYLAGESLHGLFRRKISGSVAVLIMGSSLLMLALFSLLTINLDRLMQDLRRDIDMTVFLQPAMHPEDIERLRQDLLATDGVLSVSFVSAEQALEQFRSELGPGDDELLEALSFNPLSPSLELRLDLRTQDAKRIEELARNIRQYPNVEEVIGQFAQVRLLDQAMRVFVVVDIIVGILVLLSALFVISNTVRLTIEESARQVEIMKLVGATDWFIRTPFILSGALQGAAAGALAMSTLLVAIHFARLEVGQVETFSRSQIVGFTLLSTMLGAGGSWLALRRHLTL
jgi:cell division transport system permease protein